LTSQVCAWPAPPARFELAFEVDLRFYSGIVAELHVADG